MKGFFFCILLLYDFLHVTDNLTLPTINMTLKNITNLQSHSTCNKHILCCFPSAFVPIHPSISDKNQQP